MNTMTLLIDEGSADLTAAQGGRRAILDATLRLIGRGGADAVAFSGD